MEYNELVKRMTYVNSILKLVSVVFSPNGDMFRVKSVYTIESEYNIDTEEDFKACIDDEITGADMDIDNCQCGICIIPYTDIDNEYNKDEFISLFTLVSQGWELVTVFPNGRKVRKVLDGTK